MFDSYRTRKRLKELEDEMLKLARIVESRDLDWQDMRARCKRLLDRTEKAAQRLEPLETNDGEGETNAVGAQPAPSLTLSPSQQRLQAQIMRMRR